MCVFKTTVEWFELGSPRKVSRVDQGVPGRRIHPAMKVGLKLRR